MLVDGSIEFLQCGKCGASQAHWVFSGDTDSVTQGLSSAGSRGSGLLVLGQDPVSFPDADVRTALFKRSEGKSARAVGLAFREFMKRYKAPRLIYACPWCDSGEMESSGTASARSFRAGGGSLICQGEIEILDHCK